MNHVLARQAGNIRTRPTDILPLNHRDSLSPAGKGPCRELCSYAGADDHQIVFLRRRVSRGLCAFRLTHVSSPFPEMIRPLHHLHALSAGGNDYLPGNPASVVAGEKHHRRRDIFRLRNPAQRGLSVLLLAELAFVKT